MGNPEQPSKPPPCIGAEHGYLIIAAIAGSFAALLGALDKTTDEDFPLTVYILLATLFLVGGCGWLVRSEGAQRRRDAAELREVLAELTSRVEQLGEPTPVTRVGRPTSSCRPTGHMYVSGTRQGDTVGVPAAGVDAATDPSGLTLQRAREDGIEQGFEIGYAAQLAERGVPSLPRPRQRRLTGDS